MTRRAGLVFLSLLVCRGARGDTLTLHDNSEINGRVSYANGTFTIAARYRDGEKSIKLNRADVRMIELNARDFNPGPPPKDISIFVDHSTTTRNAANDKPHSDDRMRKEALPKDGVVDHSVFDGRDFNPSIDDVLWLKTDNKLTGRLISIKDGSIAFEKAKQGKRLLVVDVSRILVAPN